MAWILMIRRAGPPILVFLLILLSVIQLSFSECSKAVSPGYTFPAGDIIIRYGDPLEIYCKLDDEYVEKHNTTTSTDLKFYSNNKSVPPEWVQIVNRTTIRLYVEKPPPSFKMYTCKLNDTGVCLNAVSVGTPPSEVQNFSCIGYNYKSLTCSWIVPQHHVKTHYNLSYHFQGRNSRMLYACPKTNRTGDVMSCYWDIYTRPHYRQTQAIYYFYLFASNVFGNYTQRFTFHHFANVVPGPPVNFTVVSKTTNSVTLQWSVETPMSQFPPGVVYRVVYQSEYDDKSVWHVAESPQVQANSTRTYNLTGLKYPHTLYDIRVSMRSSKALESNEKLWSKNVSTTVRTMSALPATPPTVNIGSFGTLNTQHDKREIYLYWRQIPEEMKNGENFTYSVISVKEGSELINKNPVEIKDSYAKFTDCSMNDYSFEIVSTNEIGHSVNRSIITVPGDFNRVPEPRSFTKVMYEDQVYELSWLEPERSHHPIKNYTIFYCRNEYDRTYPCNGILEWVEVSSNITIKNITVAENKSYQFAISANTEYGSSGMVWAACTVMPNGLHKMKNVWIDRIGGNSITISWKLDCAERVGTIEEYIFYYCVIVSPVDPVCKGPINNTTLPATSRNNFVIISNLRGYTTYMFTMSVRSKNNFSLQSDPMYNTTLEGAPEPPENVTISNVTSNSLTVEWSPPKQMNGHLRYYEVEYYAPYSEVHKVKPVNETERKLVLKNLKSFTTYNITVYASTNAQSKPSKSRAVRTAVGVPGQLQTPSIVFQNLSVIRIGWTAPKDPGGNLNMYELRMKKNINSENVTLIINTTDMKWDVQNCMNEKNNKALYISVRAVNFDNDRRFDGPWSPELQFYCRMSSRFLYWLIALLVIFGLGLMFIALKRLWYHCKIMRDVEVKLPPGLTPIADLGLTQWPVSTPKPDDPMINMRPDSSADEEHLLCKKGETAESHDRIPSGDSSGCSSGQESVTSSLASGTNLSSSSDSGTEQPRTPTSESVSRENSLRQRRTGSETLGWDSEIAWPNPKGYVSDKSITPPSSWTAKGAPTSLPMPVSNYCVLGVDTVTPIQTVDIGNHGYVPVPISMPHTEHPQPVEKSSYVTCDSVFKKPIDAAQTTNTGSPYVKTSDAMLMGGKPHAGKLMTGPTSSVVEQHPETSPMYVMAGNKSRPYVKATDLDVLSTGKLINIEPANDETMDTYIQRATDKDYVIVASGGKSTPATPTASPLSPAYVKTGDLHTVTGGDRQLPSQHQQQSPALTSPRTMTPTKGYVKTDDMLGLKGGNTPAALCTSTELGEEQTAAGVLESETSDGSELPLNSYCRLGWDSAPGKVHEPSARVDSTSSSVGAAATVLNAANLQRKSGLESSRGYVPHRHFENKSLKED